MSGGLWRQRWWLWAVPLLLVLLNAAVLSSYRLIYAGRVAALRSQIERERTELETMRSQRSELEKLVESAASSRRGIRRLYRETFATESERMAALIREVKDLATRSGLLPGQITYPEEDIGDHGLIRRSMVFTVEGTYADLRKLINLLTHFFTINSLVLISLR